MLRDFLISAGRTSLPNLSIGLTQPTALITSTSVFSYIFLRIYFFLVLSYLYLHKMSIVYSKKVVFS